MRVGFWKMWDIKSLKRWPLTTEKCSNHHSSENKGDSGIKVNLGFTQVPFRSALAQNNDGPPPASPLLVYCSGTVQLKHWPDHLHLLFLHHHLHPCLHRRRQFIAVALVNWSSDLCCYWQSSFTCSNFITTFTPACNCNMFGLVWRQLPIKL